MDNNIFFGGEDVVLTVKKGATERQIEILKKMHPGATILIEEGNFNFLENKNFGKEIFLVIDSFYDEITEICDFCEAGNNDEFLLLAA